jgi:hypothetical protein
MTSKRLVIAVDTKELSSTPWHWGASWAESIGAPAVVVSVVSYPPLVNPEDRGCAPCRRRL